jgi:hypothetical protein
MTAQIGELVRELLAGDLQSYQASTGSLDEPGWNAFGEIVGAAFYRAVEQRFGSGHEQGAAEVAEFVAAAATAHDGTPVDVGAAEALVRSVLGDEASVGAVLEQLDEPELARIELVLLRKLIDDGGPDGESVDDLVSSARDEAAQFSGEAANRPAPAAE